MQPFMRPVTLTGHRVQLHPLAHDHHDALVEAASDGELWKLWYTAIPRPLEMRAEISRRLALQETGSMLPFTTRHLHTGRVIGMTTFMAADQVNRRVEIGHTWNALSAQRTGCNDESKLLMLQLAFESWECIAVEFRTAWMNLQSRTALARLGAKQDGVLRQHQRLADGSLRDTVVFSILDSEWPAVRNELRRRVNQPG